jgi:hypothetical protein
MVFGKVVANERLTSILVDSLEYLHNISHNPEKRQSIDPTLYPAAYPSPGNSEKNFFPAGAAALSLKITVFNCAELTI